MCFLFHDTYFSRAVWYSELPEQLQNIAMSDAKNLLGVGLLNSAAGYNSAFIHIGLSLR